MKGTNKLRVLVACEFSGVVRDAFAAKGHDAWSCDLLPTERPGNHIRGDVLGVLGDGWDLLVAHPPCTHLCVSGARWFGEKKQLQEGALRFVLALFNAPIEMICVENPVGVISRRIRKPTQIVQPYQLGHATTKATCLWLKNLRPLKATCVVRPTDGITLKGPRSYGRRIPEWYSNAKGDRGKERSRTFPGIAGAMADQWTGPYRRGFGLQNQVKDRLLSPSGRPLLD